MLAALPEKRENGPRRVTRLLLHHVVIERLAIETRRCTRFQARHIEWQFAQPRSQPVGRCITDAATGFFGLADQYAAAKECANGQYHGPCAERLALVRDDTRGSGTLDDEVVDRPLNHLEVFLSQDQAPDRVTIKLAVGLRARRAHGGAFRGVQGSKLDARTIDGPRHGPAKGVDLAGQVTLANTADSRVTAHLTKRLDSVRHQQGTRARPRGSQGGFRTGVTTTNHYDVEIWHWLIFEQFWPEDARF